MPFPLIAAALVGGAIRSGVGFSQNRKKTRRDRDFANKSAKFANERLAESQTGLRQTQGESLADRGLMQGGNAEQITQATQANSGGSGVPSYNYRGLMQANSGVSGVPSSAPSTIGGQMQANTEKEFGLEFKDIGDKHRRALSDIKAASRARTFDAIKAGIKTGTSIYTMGKTLGAGKAMTNATQDVVASSVGEGASTYGENGMLGAEEPAAVAPRPAGASFGASAMGAVGNMISSGAAPAPAGHDTADWPELGGAPAGHETADWPELGGEPSEENPAAASPPAGAGLGGVSQYGISAAMTGAADASNWFGGINPFGGGSWQPQGTVIGEGQMNSEFTSG